MNRRFKTALMAIAAAVIASIALAHSDGIYNPSANNVGNFEGIDSNKASGALGPPLDGITTGIKAAYSTRKLLTVYAGNAIQVQETTGNTTSNIGFVANVLDTATLSTFCSGKTCKVITWYDQSGGGVNLTQATIANAPIIFQSGAVNAINAKPAILYVAATPTWLLNTLASAPVNTLFQNAVVKVNTASAAGTVTSGKDGSGPLEWRIDQTTGKLELLSAQVASIATSTSGVSSLTGAVVESQYNSSTGLWSFWIDRTAVGTGTNAVTIGASALQVGDGQFNTIDHLDGSIGELIMYDLVGGIPSGSRTSIEANQKAYWGTP